MALQNKTQNSSTKADKIRMIIMILAVGIIVATWQYSKNYITTKETENNKVNIVSNRQNPSGVIEFRNEFEFNPDYNDFFDVIDDVEDNPKTEMSAGEIKVRNQLGSCMFRAQPNLIQAKATKADYKTLTSDSNPNKGQIFWLAGKVIEISIAQKNENILAAQFILQYQIETNSGERFLVQSIRAPQDIRVGDIVFMNGIYLKLVKQKADNYITPLILGNYIQILLPLPAMWETKELFQKKLKKITDKSKEYITLPTELDINKWQKNYEEIIEANDKSWTTVNDKTEAESQKLSAEVEKRIISDLAIVPNTTLLDMARSANDVDWKNIKPDNFRRTIIRVTGKLESFTETMLDETINGVDKTYYAKVKDLKGNTFYFNCLKPYFTDQEDRELWKEKDQLIPKEGDIVFCVGVYIQTSMEDKARLPVLYGKQLSVIGAYYDIFNSIDHGGKRVADNDFGDLKDAGNLERMPYSYLLSKVGYTNSSTIADSFFQLKGNEITNFRGMMEDPAKNMDKPYVRYGKVLLITKYEGVLYYDFHGMQEVYEIFFFDIEKRLHTIITPTLPEGLAINQRAIFAGYFFKRYAFRNRDGNATWTPLIIGYVHEIEKEKPKELNLYEKITLGVFCIFTLFLIWYLNTKFFRTKRHSITQQANIEHAKATRDLLSDLTKKNVHLDQPLVGYFHHSLIEDLPIPLELCQNVNHWPESSDINLATLLRPDYIKNEFEAILRHYREFGTEIPRDIKAAFFNKRKELLGLRTFQHSKFEIPDIEKKRSDNILIVPLNFIKNKFENLDHLNGYMDEHGLPPWNTWIKIGYIPRYIIRNSTAAYTPDSLVIICYLPTWMAEKAKAKYKTIIKEKSIDNDSNPNEILDKG